MYIICSFKYHYFNLHIIIMYYCPPHSMRLQTWHAVHANAVHSLNALPVWTCLRTVHAHVFHVCNNSGASKGIFDHYWTRFHPCSLFVPILKIIYLLTLWRSNVLERSAVPTTRTTTTATGLRNVSDTKICDYFFFKI